MCGQIKIYRKGQTQACLVTGEIEIYPGDNVSIFAKKKKKNTAATNSRPRRQFRAATINDDFYEIVILNVSRSNIYRYDVKTSRRLKIPVTQCVHNDVPGERK